MHFPSLNRTLHFGLFPSSDIQEDQEAQEALEAEGFRPNTTSKQWDGDSPPLKALEAQGDQEDLEGIFPKIGTEVPPVGGRLMQYKDRWTFNS